MRKLRTRIYIDGYNLYYGCLRNTPYKWLNVLSLFENEIIPSILYRPENNSPACEMELLADNAVKYFTADILERAAKAGDSVSSQAHYHNALKKQCGQRLSFVKGYYAIYKSKQSVISADNPDCWPRDCEKIQVWKIEEKQSDVNLALQIYDDAIQGEIDQAVLVTNDTDLVPAFSLLKTRCPHIIRGLVIPTRKAAKEQTVERKANADLAELAHWVRGHITDDELRNSQLPDVVSFQNDRRPTLKPYSWYARPENLKKLFEMARPVLGKEGKIMSWARQPNKFLNNEKPIKLIETDEGAEKVFSYIEGYIKSNLPNDDDI